MSQIVSNFHVHNFNHLSLKSINTNIDYIMNIYSKCAIFHLKCSAEHVLPVGPHGVAALLNAGEVHEVTGSVHLVVKLLGIGQRQLVAHVGVVSHSHEVVIPGTLKRQNS